LKWFVKNPTCENVEVYEVNGKLFAEPIIPQEEPKQKDEKVLIMEERHKIMKSIKELAATTLTGINKKEYKEDKLTKLGAPPVAKQKIPYKMKMGLEVHTHLKMH
jgi:hypothetical protein